MGGPLRPCSAVCWEFRAPLADRACPRRWSSDHNRSQSAQDILVGSPAVVEPIRGIGGRENPCAALAIDGCMGWRTRRSPRAPRHGETENHKLAGFKNWSGSGEMETAAGDN